MLAPPKQKGAYPFFTFADLSISDVIKDSALGHMDIATISSGSTNGSRGGDTADPRSLGDDYSDDEFLVVECRTSPAGQLTVSLPAPVSPRQLRREGGADDDESSQGSKTTNATLNGSRSMCSDTEDSSKT